ncbi:uncharacterized protein LOC110858553 isoform X2 [Folsomia candida]|uniref:uncharacterized protein LOC110858553 isoform X2 n=1 Tax=Folsomia candida TaxID=158441 RepID=UPI001604D527|nr:uncharacterized protein LOC110858553 isoform X2 [Folsomia candida]
MLSHKLHRFVKNIRAEQRTVVAASVALGTFIRNLSVNNANQSPNSTSFCSPSFSFSSPSQMGCDEIGHRSNGSWMRFQLDQLPAGHLFRNNAINNMGFISGSVVQSYTSQKPPLSRQLHTSSLFMSIYSRTTSIHLQLLQEKKSTSTLGFNGRNTRFLMTPQDQRFYSKGKDDKESESSNNLLNDSKTSANGAGRPNLDLPINTIPIKDGLQTRASVTEFLGHLTEEQKGLLYHSLNVVVLRDKYEGHLGSSKSESHHYLSKFGRPTAAVGEEPTGTLCEVPPKWLHTRLDEKLHPPSAAAIWAVGIKNALPFIGFGFLDNLIMILAVCFLPLLSFL